MARTKPIVGIDCEGPARAGIVLGLSARFEDMCALRDRALDFSNPEGVHDMRVASRRLRGALADFMPYLKRRRLSGCLEEIRNIASALGRIRDQDVAIITLTETAARAPANIGAGILRFADLRRADLEEARARLGPALDSEGLRLLRQKVAAGLDDHKAHARSGQSRSTVALPRYRDVAASIILKRLEDLESASRSLYRPLRVKPLHDLRIRAKHLRYALELFAPCWGNPMLLFADKAAGLQSSLGKLHDCDVWLEDFGDFATADDNLDHESSAASVWLLRHFAKLRSRHFGNALSQWHEWELEEISARLREIIHSNAPRRRTLTKKSRVRPRGSAADRDS